MATSLRAGNATTLSQSHAWEYQASRPVGAHKDQRSRDQITDPAISSSVQLLLPLASPTGRRGSLRDDLYQGHVAVSVAIDYWTTIHQEQI